MAQLMKKCPLMGGNPCDDSCMLYEDYDCEIAATAEAIKSLAKEGINTYQQN